MRRWNVYVEGKSDQRFLECVTRHLGIEEIEYRTIGTNIDGLRKMEPELLRSLDAGRRIAAVVDANANVEKRNEKLRRIVEEVGVSLNKFFLLPDNQRPGCLETLLEEIAVQPHQQIYRCFDEYQNCISSMDPAYEMPNDKARIYAYCNALGANA